MSNNRRSKALKAMNGWTKEYVQRLCKLKLSDYDAQSITDAANAALAARIKTTEYAQGWDDHLAASRKQLAALKEQDEVHWKTRRSLLKQLSAEREQHSRSVSALAEAHKKELDSVKHDLATMQRDNDYLRHES